MKTIGYLLLVTFLVACTHLPKSGSPNWQLLYSHDKEGKMLAGSKAALLNHVEQGRPVRIFWSIDDDFAHVLDAGFLTIMNNELFAQSTGIVRQIPNFEGSPRIALDAHEQSHWHAIFSTTGEVRHFQSLQAELRDSRFELRWYGQQSTSQ